jgi:hypothetical protein
MIAYKDAISTWTGIQPREIVNFESADPVVYFGINEHRWNLRNFDPNFEQYA